MRPAWSVDRSRLGSSGLYVAAWTLFGLYFFSKTLIFRTFWFGPVSWTALLAFWMVHAYVWAALAPVVVRLADRFPVGRRKPLINIPAHIALSLVFAVCVAALVAFWAPQPRPGATEAAMRPTGRAVWAEMVATLNQNILPYWLILIIQHAVQYHRRYREREQDSQQLEIQASALRARLAEAEFATLRAHLQPRFVFDTLDAISEAVTRAERGQAEEMVGRLGDFLRGMLEDVDTPMIPLCRELEHLELYLAIERIRLGGGFHVTVSADSDTLDASVPCRSVQPLVASVIRHHVDHSSSVSDVNITVDHDDELTITVEVRRGPEVVCDRLSESSLPFETIRSRLQSQFGDVARVSVNRAPDGAFVVKSVLSYRVSVDTHEPSRVQAGARHLSA